MILHIAGSLFFILMLTLLTLFPKNNFEESECTGTPKSFDQIINSLNTPISRELLKDSSRIILLEGSTMIAMYKGGVDLFASFTEGSQGKINLGPLGINDEYSFHKYLNEIGVVDLVSLNLELLFSKISMLILNEVAYKYHPENLYFIKVGNLKNILIKKNNSQNYYDISFFEKGRENYQVDIRSKSIHFQDDYIKDFACSVITKFPIP